MGGMAGGACGCTGAESGEQVENGQAGVGLDRVADQVRRLGKCLGVGLEGRFKRLPGVDVERGAESFGKRVQRHVLKMEAAIDAIQGVQP